MKRIFCIIPARSGSKRIKNKNILKFYRIPLIGRTIKTAKKTKIFEKIIVSSDSRKIIIILNIFIQKIHLIHYICMHNRINEE